ncbi:uncharacterized protein LOC111254317 [Varroa destructor]|uniref:Uncharacterized protein n=1 Tax=Varroa destructor TaxID=109461 RepID=A0A7M7KR73_VARDE|nr:uncharacterized protein LOC111254317 [Varroa destructor]
MLALCSPILDPLICCGCHLCRRRGGQHRSEGYVGTYGRCFRRLALSTKRGLTTSAFEVKPAHMSSSSADAGTRVKVTGPAVRPRFDMHTANPKRIPSSFGSSSRIQRRQNSLEQSVWGGL